VYKRQILHRAIPEESAGGGSVRKRTRAGA